MTPRAALFRWEELPLEKVTEMVTRKVVACGPSTVVQAYFKKGAIVPAHAHGTDLVLYVLQGAIRAHVDHEEITVREGDLLVVPAGAPHHAESLDDTFVMTFRSGA